MREAHGRKKISGAMQPIVPSTVLRRSRLAKPKSVTLTVGRLLPSASGSNVMMSTLDALTSRLQTL